MKRKTPDTASRSRLSNGHPKYQALIPGTCHCYLIRKEESLQMWLSWRSWRGTVILNYLGDPKCHHKGPHKRQAEGDSTQRGGGGNVNRNRGWRHVTTSQGILEASRSQKRQGIDFSLGASGVSVALQSPWFYPPWFYPGILCWFRMSGLQSCEKTNFCCVKPQVCGSLLQLQETDTPRERCKPVAPQWMRSTRASHRLCNVPVIKYEQPAKNQKRLEKRV